MRRIPLALALVGAFAVTGCAGGAKPSAPATSGVQKGVTGQYFYVNIHQPPVGGTIASSDGRINCGASAVAVNNAVTPPQYAYTFISSLCGTSGQTQYPLVQGRRSDAEYRDPDRDAVHVHGLHQLGR